jgi:SAM-dependent methyltransferase
MEDRSTSSKLNVLYKVQDLPLIQNIVYQSSEIAKNCAKGDILLAQDMHSGIVSNISFDSNKMIYDENYDNNQALSEEFQKHLVFSQSIILKYFNVKSKIVEIGCGNGIFIDMLSKKGFCLQGFDPAYKGNNKKIHKEYYDFKSNKKYDGIIMRHVLEHIANPTAFLNNVAESMNYKGIIYIEVPCFDYIYNKNNWFDVFYEHVNYFTISDFEKIFENIIECGHCFGGQYIYVVADISKIRMPPYERVNKIPKKKEFGFQIDKQMQVDDIIWGGASKGVIYSLLRARYGVPVRAVIDINKNKQGRYLPGTGLMVRCPSDILPSLKPDTRIMLMNPNYADEIKKQTCYKFRYINIENNKDI